MTRDLRPRGALRALPVPDGVALIWHDVDASAFELLQVNRLGRPGAQAPVRITAGAGFIGYPAATWTDQGYVLGWNQEERIGANPAMVVRAGPLFCGQAGADP